MTKARHTSAPWFYEHSHLTALGGAYLVKSTNAARTPIALIPETMEANARLIAAAPELLEALEEMISIYSTRVGTGCNHLKECKKALAAINKAKGE